MKLFAAAMLALTLSTTATLAGPPLRLWIKNASTVTIDKLWVEIMGSDWGAERLRGETIEPKGKMQFMLEDGVNKCWADIKVLSTAGKEYAYRASLCEEGHTFTFRGRP